MDWLQLMKSAARTVDTAGGAVVITPETSLELMKGTDWTTLTYKATNGMRVWLESGLACESYPGAVTAVGNDQFNVVIFDSATGESLGCYRAVDICALSPMDVGLAGAKSVISLQRSHQYRH